MARNHDYSDNEMRIKMTRNRPTMARSSERSAFILEYCRQTGSLMVEAAAVWDGQPAMRDEYK